MPIKREKTKNESYPPQIPEWIDITSAAGLWADDYYFSKAENSDISGNVLEPAKKLREINTNEERNRHYGQPYVPEDAALYKMKEVTVRGCGEAWDRTRTINVHAKVQALFQQAFDAVYAHNMALPEEERYIIFSVYGHIARYMDHLKPLMLQREDQTRNKGKKSEKTYLYADYDYDALWEGLGAKWETHKRGGKDVTAWWHYKDGKRNKKPNKFPRDWRAHALEYDTVTPGRTVHSIVSNHAYGTAVDINASFNKYDKRFKWKVGYVHKRLDIPPWLTQIFLDHGFRWGGFYGDYMHFEFMRKVGETPPPRPRIHGAKQWVLPVDKDAATLYAENEAQPTGHFPVGGFNLWHGGIHLPAPAAVRSIADGTIVAARLPETDPFAPDSTSRNFVLVRHQLQGRAGDKNLPLKPLWSLYVHLQPFRYEANDARTKELTWFAKRLANYRSDLDLSKRYYVVHKAEDKRKGEKKRTGVNLRAEPTGKKKTKKGEVLDVAPQWTILEGVGEPEPKAKWLHVQVTSGTTTPEGKPGQRIGGAAPTSVAEGWIYVKSVRLIQTDELAAIRDLRQGAVAALNVPVKAGQKLGDADSYLGRKVVHVETFSTDALHEHVPELGAAIPAGRRWEDTDNDALVDVAELITLVEEDVTWPWSKNRQVTHEEAQEAASKLRNVAVRHQTEWGAADWSPLKQAPWNLDAADFSTMNRFVRQMQWWSHAKSAGAKLPADQKVWHYHPVTLVTALQKAFAPGGSLEKPAPGEYANAAPGFESIGEGMGEAFRSGAAGSGAGSPSPASAPSAAKSAPGQAGDYGLTTRATTVPASVWEAEWEKAAGRQEQSTREAATKRLSTKKIKKFGAAHPETYPGQFLDATPLDQIKVTHDAAGTPRVLSFIANLSVDADGHTDKVLGKTGFKDYWAMYPDLSEKEAIKQLEAEGLYYDKHRQSSTSGRWNGQAFDPVEIPYIVLPPQLRCDPCGGGMYDLARVRYGDKTVYAVVGDQGPWWNVGEASMRVARALGLKQNPRYGGKGKGAANQVIEYIVLCNSAPARKRGDFDAIQALGRAAFQAATETTPPLLTGGAAGQQTWQFPTAPHEASQAEKHYAANEQGSDGFFPVGSNRLWHGGVHLPGGEVKACADGRIVAARLEAKGSASKTPRGFVLVRHELALSGKTAPVWSLYYHLSPVTFEGRSGLPWLDRLAAPYDPEVRAQLKAQTGNAARYLRITTSEDNGGLNMRATPAVKSNNKVTLPDGTTRIPQGTLVEYTGEVPLPKWAPVHYEGQDGYVSTRGRVELIESAGFKALQSLEAGNVTPLDLPVSLGELVGRTGSKLHFEVFSQDLLTPFTQAPFEHLKDPNDDPVADATDLLERAGGALATLFTPGGAGAEAKQAAPETQHLTVEHVSEWAAKDADWERLKNPPWNLDQAELDRALEEIRAHQFWNDLGPGAPTTPRVVSYHPITFVSTIAEALANSSS